MRRGSWDAQYLLILLVVLAVVLIGVYVAFVFSGRAQGFGFPGWD